MNNEFQMLAKTFKGLEQVLAKELIELGELFFNHHLEALSDGHLFSGYVDLHTLTYCHGQSFL